MTLERLNPGERCRILAVADCPDSPVLRDRLLDMGLTPGTEIFIRRRAPMGDPVEIYLRGYELTLRLSDAKLITVERLNA